MYKLLGTGRKVSFSVVKCCLLDSCSFVLSCVYICLIYGDLVVKKEGLGYSYWFNPVTLLCLLPETILSVISVIVIFFEGLRWIRVVIGRARLWLFGTPRLMKLWGPLRHRPSSNSPASVCLKIVYSWNILATFT